MTIFRKPINCIVVIGSLLSSSIFAADETYHCEGKYNTGADYDHVYTVDRALIGGTVDWGGQKFKIQDFPLYLFAVAIKSNGVDIIFIDEKKLNVEFSSVRYGSPFFAKGKCRKLK